MWYENHVCNDDIRREADTTAPTEMAGSSPTHAERAIIRMSSSRSRMAASEETAWYPTYHTARKGQNDEFQFSYLRYRNLSD